MAEAAVGALGASATLVASKIGYSLAFTARHENNHRAEALDIERTSEAIMKAYKSGDVSDRDFLALLERRSISIELNTLYYQSIEEYKDVNVLHVVEKLVKRDHVRKNKRAAVRANHKLREYYYESLSDCSDTSSTTADSGSPPYSEGIREWSEGVDAYSFVDVEAFNDPGLSCSDERAALAGMFDDLPLIVEDVPALQEPAVVEDPWSTDLEATPKYYDSVMNNGASREGYGFLEGLPRH